MSAQPSKTLPQSSELPLSETSLDKPEFTLVTCQCEQHGAYQAYRYPDGTSPTPLAVDCPRCIDETTARYGAEKRARADAAAARNRLREIVACAGIPPRFADRTIIGYRATTSGQKVAQGICQGFADNWDRQLRTGGSLVMTGGPGTGKTHLACAIANRIMVDHLASVAFGTVASVLRSVKSTYGGKGDETKALADLMKPDLLIIDEIGIQNGSEHELTLLFEIINTRYQNLRPTILISNLDAEALEKFLGQRVMDRFRECGSVLAFDWSSFRGQQSVLV